jgi:hypothetical protein
MVTTNFKYLFKMVLFNLRLSEECNWYEFIALNMYFFVFCYFFFKLTFYFIYIYIFRRIRVHRLAPEVQENPQQEYLPLTPPPPLNPISNTFSRVYPSLANFNDNNNSIEVENFMDMDDKIFEEIMTNYLTRL